MENIKGVVEAIIFSSGAPIAKKDICEKVPELTTSALNSIIYFFMARAALKGAVFAGSAGYISASIPIYFAKHSDSPGVDARSI